MADKKNSKTQPFARLFDLTMLGRSKGQVMQKEKKSLLLEKDTLSLFSDWTFRLNKIMPGKVFDWQVITFAIRLLSFHLARLDKAGSLESLDTWEKLADAIFDEETEEKN